MGNPQPGYGQAERRQLLLVHDNEAEAPNVLLGLAAEVGDYDFAGNVVVTFVAFIAVHGGGTFIFILGPLVICVTESGMIVAIARSGVV